jgi:hypothetical protein
VTDTRVRTCSRAAPSDRSATVATGCESSNVLKKDKNASVSFRCDSGLIFASDDVETDRQNGQCPCRARLTATMIGGCAQVDTRGNRVEVRVTDTRDCGKEYKATV